MLSLIQKSKQPQGNHISIAYLDVVLHDPTVGNVPDLLLLFVFPAYLQRVAVCHQKIALVSQAQRIPGIADLIGNEGLPQIAVNQCYTLSVLPCFLLRDRLIVC